MLRNVRNAERVANCAVSVLIRGPTGSGKEAFAKVLHLASNRARRPFVAVNCAAIPEALIESELFGYTAGTFTGARKEGLRGRIVQSSGGTLFLDEIGDLPPGIGQPGGRYLQRHGASATDQDLSLEAAEREALLRVIEKNDWVMSHVAAQLGISRNTLYRKIKRHCIPLTRN